MATKKWHFRTPIDEPITTVTPSGTEEEEILAMKIDDKGNETFYVKGKTNVWEKTQAFKEETEIETILRRVTDTGDTSILVKSNPQYIDITEMPENVFEAHQKIKEAEEVFNNLPLEIRKKYEYNFNKYLADFGTKEWQRNMGLLEEKTPEPTPEKGEEVNE